LQTCKCKTGTVEIKPGESGGLWLSLLDTTTDAGPLLYNAEDMIEKWLIRRE